MNPISLAFKITNKISVDEKLAKMEAKTNTRLHQMEQNYLNDIEMMITSFNSQMILTTNKLENKCWKRRISYIRGRELSNNFP